MERKLPRAPSLEVVMATKRDLDKHTVETEALQLVKFGSIVVIEFIGDNPQRKRVQLVDSLDDDQVGIKHAVDVDMHITDISPIGKKIMGQPASDVEIFINAQASLKIIEVTNPE